MKKKELFQQLNSLKGKIKPDPTWQVENRDLLLSQIKAQTQQLDMKLSPFKVFNFSKFALTVAKPVGSLLVIAVIIFGSYTASVGATRKSLPGDLLYPVKISTERVQVNLTLNDEKRINLEIAFAERRLDEIKVIVAQDTDLNEQEDLDVPLRHFQESMVNVKSNLAKMEKSDKVVALVLANLIDEKTKEYVAVLIDNKEKFTEDTADAISASKNIGDKALDLIIDDLEEDDQTTASLDEIKQKVESRIITLANDLALAEANINKIVINKELADAQAALDAEEEAVAEEDETSEPEEADTEESSSAEATDDKDEESVPVEEDVNPIDQVKKDLAQANALLVQAQELLAADSLGEAFELIKQANEILVQINIVISDYDQYLESEDEPVIEVDPVDSEEGDIIGIFNSEE